MLVDASFTAIGLKPNADFLPPEVQKTTYGHIVTQFETTRTSLPGLFAAGDVVDAIYRQAITSAGSGCKAALDAEKYLSNL